MKKGHVEDDEGSPPSSDKTNGTTATGDVPQSVANPGQPETSATSTGLTTGTATAQKPGLSCIYFGDIKVKDFVSQIC